MKAQPIKSLSFTDDLSKLDSEFAERRVAVELGNTSGLGVNNTWCEIRTEPSTLALGYHVFEDATSAEEFCKSFGTVTEVTSEAARRWNYLMRGAA